MQTKNEVGFVCINMCVYEYIITVLRSTHIQNQPDPLVLSLMWSMDFVGWAVCNIKGKTKKADYFPYKKILQAYNRLN